MNGLNTMERKDGSVVEEERLAMELECVMWYRMWELGSNRQSLLNCLEARFDGIAARCIMSTLLNVVMTGIVKKGTVKELLDSLIIDFISAIFERLLLLARSDDVANAHRLCFSGLLSSAGLLLSFLLGSPGFKLQCMNAALHLHLVLEKIVYNAMPRGLHL